MGSEQDTEDYSNIWDFEFTKLQLTQVTEPWPAGPDNHDDHDDYSDNPWRSNLHSTTKKHKYVRLCKPPSRSAINQPLAAVPSPTLAVDISIPLDHQK